MNITKQLFGTTAKGEIADLYTLTNKNGMVAKITNYGAILTSLQIPQGDSNQETVLGFDSLSGYLHPNYLSDYPFFGAIIGRFGNRINKGQFTLEGKQYQLACNQAPHHLHGGDSGFDKKLWNAEILEKEDPTLQLTCLSCDGEENYPGNLTVCVTYTLTSENELCIEYKATCDASTPINLTNHSYFNLTGGKESIHNHHLQIHSEKILDIDQELIPTGKLNSVADTPFDFLSEKPLGRDIEAVGGYDNCYVFDKNSDQVNKVALLSSPDKSIQMEVHTNSPSMQLYTGRYINVEAEKTFGAYGDTRISRCP